jgi:transcriptional regulator with XRE-family HTH domain
MNTAELKGRIVAKGFTTERFCKEAGIVRSTFDRKMSGKSEFDRSEMLRMIRVLNLNMDEVYNIFFAKEVA